MESDLQDLYEYLLNSEVVKYQPYKPKEIKHNIKWRTLTDEMIGVVLKNNYRMIGNVDLREKDFELIEIG